MTVNDAAGGSVDRPVLEDGTSLGAAVRSGQVGAVEAMKAAIRAADRHASFGALNWLDADMGLGQARAFDAWRAASSDALEAAPFDGVPFLVKDLGSPFAGIPVHAGSAALARRLPAPPGDGELAARFRRAGFIPLGRTSVPEFGLSLASGPDGSAPVLNPLAPSLTAGGSSGGAAAAVAIGIVAIAHATDADGLPLPVQIPGPIGSDLVLLDLAGRLAAERPFRLPFPLAGLA